MLTLSYLNTLDPVTRQKVIVAEFIKCKKDPIYTIQTYFSVKDAAKGALVPFVLYPHQIRAISDFEHNPLNITMKTRQMGFTAVSSAYTAWYMCTKRLQTVNALAQEKKTSRKFLRQVRETLDEARKKAPWLVADYSPNNNGKDSFTIKTGCIITAEANKPDACRGDTINLLIIDEVAAISHMDEIWSSAGLTLSKSRGKCIAISTPKGQSGWYFDQYTNALENGWRVIEAHWSEHPEYMRGMYQYVKDINHPEGGHIKYFNDEWPDVDDPIQRKKYFTKETYPYMLDGRLRSPWYDYESKRLGLQRTRCELDCSFAGSGSEVIDPEVVRAMRMLAKETPMLDTAALGFENKGMWKSLKIFRMYNPDHGYILSADVATGDGTDFSSIVIMDITTHEVVCTYKEHVDPIFFARIIKWVATYYGQCMVMVEYQGPGLTVLMELKNNLKYSKLYYSAIKKAEPTKVQKRKIGFWQGQSTKALGGDKIEEYVNTNAIKIYSEDLISEFDTWIWGSDGKRDHAPGRNDDLIMALSNALFYMVYVLAKRQMNQNMMTSHFRREIVGELSLNTTDMFDWRSLLNDQDETKSDYMKDPLNTQPPPAGPSVNPDLPT
jgi:hypothetical protein